MYHPFCHGQSHAMPCSNIFLSSVAREERGVHLADGGTPLNGPLNGGRQTPAI